MNLRFSVKKIHCVKPTKTEWGKDEIYCVLVPVLGTVKDDFLEDDKISEEDFSGTIVQGCVSTVKSDVTKETLWCPDGASLSFDSGDAKIVNLLLFLYEEDDGKIRKKLHNTLTNKEFQITIEENTDFKAILTKVIASVKEVIPAIAAGGKLGVAMAVLKAVFQILPLIISEIRRDDFIDFAVVEYKTEDTDTISLPREYILTGKGAEYKVGVELQPS